VLTFSETASNRGVPIFSSKGQRSRSPVVNAFQNDSHLASVLTSQPRRTRRSNV